MRYAVNLCDLTELAGPTPGGPFVLQILLGDFLSASPFTVTPDKGRLDTRAVVLDGPAASDAARVEALVDLLQIILGPKRLGRRVRCYAEGPRGGWTEIRPSRAMARLLHEVRPQ